MKSLSLAVFAGLVFAVGGCGLNIEPSQTVTLAIDGVNAPARVSPGTSISVVVRVMVAECMEFDQLVVNRNTAGATIAAVGHLTDDGGAECDGPATLAPHTLVFDPPFESTFTITVIRLGQTALSVVVQVQ